jgi:hypothetical protein
VSEEISMCKDGIPVPAAHPLPRKQRRETRLCKVETGEVEFVAGRKVEKDIKKGGEIVYAFDAIVVSCFVE